MTYRISEKERIKQRRAARLQVADRRVDGLATSEVLEPLSTIHQQSHAPQRRGDDSKNLKSPAAGEGKKYRSPLPLGEG